MALFGCEDDFDPASRVVDLRVLAVQADQPFAQPGEEVHLRALYVDPEARALSWGWGICEESASTAAADCVRAIQFDGLSIGGASEYRVTVPADALDDLPGDEKTTFLGVVVVACPGSIERGETEEVPVTCLDAQGRALPLESFEIGMKRVFVRGEGRNQNPVIEEVRWDGEPWPEEELKIERCGADCKKHKVEVRAPGAQERSTDEFGESVVEQVVAQFYASGGTFDEDVRILDEAHTRWRARKEDIGQLIRFWFVVRDDRGGVTWTSRELRVE
jgi:hypothetical protein